MSENNIPNVITKTQIPENLEDYEKYEEESENIFQSNYILCTLYQDMSFFYAPYFL